ncbi:MAG: Crp/Fnr family transcriptional regulator [Peptococcaceae bacterium]
MQQTAEITACFSAVGQIREFTAGEVIDLQGERSSCIHLIVKGRVRIYLTGDNGKEITCRIAGQGQLLGESAFLGYGTRPTMVAAVNAVTLISCRVSQLKPYLRESAELNETVLSLLTDNYETLCAQVKRLTIYNRFQRVASYLLDQTKRDDKELGILDGTLPYTHEELGVCLNLNRVTVTGILNQFQKQGMVKLGRKKIKVVDREKLQTVVEQI